MADVVCYSTKDWGRTSTLLVLVQPSSSFFCGAVSSISCFAMLALTSLPAADRFEVLPTPATKFERISSEYCSHESIIEVSEILDEQSFDKHCFSVT